MEKKIARRLLSVPEIADYFGISVRTAWSWVYGRRIPSVRISGTVRIPMDEVERIIEDSTTPAITARSF